MSNNAVVEKILSKKSNMFKTFNSIGDLIESQNITGEQVAVVLMAVNTTLQMIADDPTITDAVEAEYERGYDNGVKNAEENM